jgi:hypothetical protein
MKETTFRHVGSYAEEAVSSGRQGIAFQLRGWELHFARREIAFFVYPVMLAFWMDFLVRSTLRLKSWICLVLLLCSVQLFRGAHTSAA